MFSGAFLRLKTYKKLFRFQETKLIHFFRCVNVSCPYLFSIHLCVLGILTHGQNVKQCYNRKSTISGLIECNDLVFVGFLPAINYDFPPAIVLLQDLMRVLP